MSLEKLTDQSSFFRDPGLDEDLPAVNDAFWAALIGHIEQDGVLPRTVLDVGCHRGGLLLALYRRFSPVELIGIEPLESARSAASRLLDRLTATVRLFDLSGWSHIPDGSMELVTSHEVLYLEPDLNGFMKRVHRVMATNGSAYIVLGSHAENPLWGEWKKCVVMAGHSVYDYQPLQIMKAASAAGLVASVQPLRRSGWVTYDPLRAEFPYPDVQTMLDHHYRHKLIFRLVIADERTIAA